jgi:FlaA1/EpsC-like NDP-sugar epimerase
VDQEALLTGTAEPLARQRGGGLAERLRRDAPLAAIDLGVAFFCYLLTLALRFDGSVPDRYWSSFWRFLPIALAIHLVVNQLGGLYGQMWRYASAQEARRIVLTGCAAGVAVVSASVLVGLATDGRGLRALPLSVTVFGAVLTLLGTGARSGTPSGAGC